MLEQRGKGTVAGTVTGEYSGCDDFIILDVVDFEGLRLAEMLENRFVLFMIIMLFLSFLPLPCWGGAVSESGKAFAGQQHFVLQAEEAKGQGTPGIS